MRVVIKELIAEFLSGESESFPSPPLSWSFTESVHDDKGIKVFNVLWPPWQTALSACLFNQNPFKLKVLIEAAKIVLLCRLCWSIFFPPIDQTVVHNCLTGFETKVHADWNISSPPVNQRLSKFFLVRAFCPPWTSFAEILTWCCLCACPCISICFVCALRSLSVTVFSRESHRAFVFRNMGEITLLGQKKEKTKEKRFWDVTLFLYSHL